MTITNIAIKAGRMISIHNLSSLSVTGDLVGGGEDVGGSRHTPENSKLTELHSFYTPFLTGSYYSKSL
jgi:hypothetical protein